jgi:predicted RNase H-like HicB family nuclease
LEIYRYFIIIEKGEHNYSAYVPDLPGCITTGATYEEVQRNMREAITLHLRGIIEDQAPIPVPQTMAEYTDIMLPNSAA